MWPGKSAADLRVIARLSGEWTLLSIYTKLHGIKNPADHVVVCRNYEGSFLYVSFLIDISLLCELYSTILRGQSKHSCYHRSPE